MQLTQSTRLLLHCTAGLASHGFHVYALHLGEFGLHTVATHTNTPTTTTTITTARFEERKAMVYTTFYTGVSDSVPPPANPDGRSESIREVETKARGGDDGIKVCGIFDCSVMQLAYMDCASVELYYHHSTPVTTTLLG